MNSLQQVSLSPSQLSALQGILAARPLTNLFELQSRSGLGRSTVLRTLRDLTGGRLLSIADFLDQSTGRHPLALEDALYDMLLEALQQHDTVLVDDFHLATAVMAGCHFYPRSGLLNAPLAAIAAYTIECGKTLILGSDSCAPDPISERSIAYSIEPFGVEDYDFLCRQFFGDAWPGDQLEMERVFHFAPKLTAHQLRNACVWLSHQPGRSTRDFIEYLRSQRLASNVELGEVTQVSLAELKGVDEVIQRLEANVALPMEREDLAEELGLKAKRGVLLSGPPGTGKTTVGRALAHRLKGKFFLIDGTIISGTRDFYEVVHRTFKAAMDNAPSVIFIDDSDVIFESGGEHGLYRYLLTMLDGLESKSAGRVCVMLTAMNVGNLPPALIRSGRVELWLEMKLPDEHGRKDILQQVLVKAPRALRDPDVDLLVERTGGFTGADLNRICDDAKVLYAYDRSQNATLRTTTAYFLAAIDEVRQNKERYAVAEAAARAVRPNRPPWFQVPFSFSDMQSE